jgi:hypothetical protein
MPIPIQYECCVCKRPDAELWQVGDENMPLCSDCNWGAQDINDANKAAEGWVGFWNRLQTLGMRFRRAEDKGKAPKTTRKPFFRN